MAGSSLLALIDDIATLLDDVSVMTKVATKKTAGVLGDDLALNAQQVSGVNADRELPVVWAVAKGSAINKAILVPAALALSTFLPQAVIPLMMIGGAFLCFEGVEKIAHKFFHSAAEDKKHHDEMLTAITNENVDMVAFEKDKIKGAIRTDFILSAEIIVITLGTVADKDFVSQLSVLIAISVIMTIGVYGLVAGIVKLDDGGLYLTQRPGTSTWVRFKHAVGKTILWGAPYLMKSLSILGTAAMFLVGGGILTHSISALHHFIESLAPKGSTMAMITSLLADAIVGIITGIIVLLVVEIIKKLFFKKKASA
jgi:uncharacterized protein